MITLPVFKEKKYVHIHIAILCQFKCWKYFFTSGIGPDVFLINELKDCIIFLIWAAWVLFNFYLKQKNAGFKDNFKYNKVFASLDILYKNSLNTKVQKQNVT